MRRKKKPDYRGLAPLIGIIIFLVVIFVIAGKSFGTTYYVREAGSDGAAGTAWNTAWATVDKVNDNISKGDSVFFGTGTYYNYEIVPPSGAGTNWTVYACSTYEDGQDLSGKFLPRIRSGKVVTGTWTVHAGNIWKTFFANDSRNTYGDPPSGKEIHTLVNVTEDSIYCSTEALGNITEGGEFDYKPSVGSLYVWNMGNGDPNDDSIYASIWPVVYHYPSKRYIKYIGLNLEGGVQGVTVFDDETFDHIEFHYCHMDKISFLDHENPAIFFSEAGATTSDILIRACSLGTGIQESSSGLSDAYGHGGTFDWYSTSNITVESCFVYATGANGILYKINNNGNIVRYNTILGGSGIRGINMHLNADNVEIYGNLLIGNFDQGAISVGGGNGTNNMICYNNTIVNNNGYNIHIGNMDNDGTGSFTGKAEIKWNLIYNYGLSGDLPINSKVVGYDHRNCSGCDIVIDNNAYYSATTAEFQCNGNGNDTWTAWQSGGDCNEDGNSHDPTIDYGLQGDYSLPDTTSLTMDSTYGGRTWSVYGAVQQDGEVRRLPLGPDSTLSTIDDMMGLLYHRAHGGGGANLDDGKGLMLPMITPGDADGESVDSIIFHTYDCEVETDYVFGVYSADLGTLIAEQTTDATILADDTGWYSVTNWTNHVTLENYTHYWLLLHHNTTDNFRFHMGDMPDPTTPIYNRTFNFGTIFDDTIAASKYDGSAPTVEEMASTHFSKDGTGHEMAPFFLFYDATTPQDTMEFVTSFSEVSDASFYLKASWNLPADSVLLHGTQKQSWLCETPSISLSVYLTDVTKKFTIPGDSVLVDGTYSPEWQSACDGLGEAAGWDGDLKPGVPYYHRAQVWFNDLRYYHDSMSVLRIPNIYTNNIYTTSDIASDSFNLFDDFANTNSFNPTQEDSIIITNEDTLHSMAHGFTSANIAYTSVSWPEMSIDKALFKSDHDTTFADLIVEEWGTFKMHGGERVNVLTYDLSGRMIMTATDTFCVWDADTLIYHFASFADTVNGDNVDGITTIANVTSSSLNIIYNVSGDTETIDSIVVYGDDTDASTRIEVLTQIPSDTTVRSGLTPESDYFAKHASWWTVGEIEYADTSDVFEVQLDAAADVNRKMKGVKKP